jgi:Uma2 family endonuclease
MAQLALDRSIRNAQHRSSYPADWFIEDDEPMSQSREHDLHEIRISALLEAWRIRTGRDLIVGRELAFRWDEGEARVGADPDVYVAETPPADADGNIPSVCTWKDGHAPPLLAIEIVSKSRPKKDYVRSPERHDLLGTFELWVFDPSLYGHSTDQESVSLQMFQRETNNHLAQTYSGNGPVFSDVLEAWVLVVDAELVISYDREGKDRWLTLEEEALQYAEAQRARGDAERLRADGERERADAERLRADGERERADAERIEKEKALKQADAERVEKENVLARLAELELLLAQRK